MKRLPENEQGKPSLRRQVYVLICWQERGDPEKAIWRFSLEIPGEGQRRLFGSLERVLETIETELDQNNTLD